MLSSPLFASQKRFVIYICLQLKCCLCSQGNKINISVRYLFISSCGGTGRPSIKTSWKGWSWSMATVCWVVSLMVSLYRTENWQFLLWLCNCSGLHSYTCCTDFSAIIVDMNTVDMIFTCLKAPSLYMYHKPPPHTCSKEQNIQSLFPRVHFDQKAITLTLFSFAEEMKLGLLHNVLW